jgi:hypothetical protein
MDNLWWPIRVASALCVPVVLAAGITLTVNIIDRYEASFLSISGVMFVLCGTVVCGLFLGAVIIGN